MSGGFGASGSGFGAPAHLGDVLSALIDGELPVEQEAQARSHLTTCAGCTRELQAVSQARTWLRALPLVDPPFGFYERMLLDGAQPVAAAFGTRASIRRRAGVAAIGAAAAAVTVLGVGSPSRPPVSPSVPRLVEAHATSASVGADLLSKLAPVGIPVSFNR